MPYTLNAPWIYAVAITDRGTKYFASPAVAVEYALSITCENPLDGTPEEELVAHIEDGGTAYGDDYVISVLPLTDLV